MEVYTTVVELDGRVAIVTGGGRGLGREYALLLASHGVRVVVNDLGVDSTGVDDATSPADAVAGEIAAAGGSAIADSNDASTWSGAEAVVAAAIDAFGISTSSSTTPESCATAASSR